MKSSWLSKHKTTVRHVLSIGVALVFVSPPVRAQTAPQPPPYYQQKELSCEDVKSKINELAGKIGRACKGESGSNPSAVKSCMQRVSKCDNAEIQAYDSGNDSEDTNADACERARSMGCPVYNDGNRDDAKADKKDAKERRKDLEKERDQANDQAQQDQQNQQEEQNKIEDDQAKADEDWQKNRKEVTDKLQKDLADIDDAKLKGMKDAQEQYDKLDVEYIKMRDKLRRLQSAQNQLDLSWKVQCRNAADANARETEAALDKRSAEEDQIIRNYQLSNAAGKNRRLLKKKRTKILDQYMQTLNKCLKGDIPPGADIKLNLDKAKNELHDEQNLSADAAARLEKLRQQILESMKQLQQSLGKKQAMVVQQAQEAIQLMDQTHTATMQRLQKRAMQAQQNAQKKEMQNYLKSIKMGKDLKEAKADESNASARAMCSGGFSNSSAKDEHDAQKAAQEALPAISNYCVNLDDWVHTTCGDHKPPICSLAKNYEDKTNKDGLDSSSSSSGGNSTRRGSSSNVAH